jgi:hypothetical protein
MVAVSSAGSLSGFRLSGQFALERGAVTSGESGGTGGRRLS